MRKQTIRISITLLMILCILLYPCTYSSATLPITYAATQHIQLDHLPDVTFDSKLIVPYTIQVSGLTPNGPCGVYVFQYGTGSLGFPIHYQANSEGTIHPTLYLNKSDFRDGTQYCICIEDETSRATSFSNGFTAHFQPGNTPEISLIRSLPLENAASAVIPFTLTNTAPNSSWNIQLKKSDGSDISSQTVSSDASGNLSMQYQVLSTEIGDTGSYYFKLTGANQVSVCSNSFRLFKSHYQKYWITSNNQLVCSPNSTASLDITAGNLTVGGWYAFSIYTCIGFYWYPVATLDLGYVTSDTISASIPFQTNDIRSGTRYSIGVTHIDSTEATTLAADTTITLTTPTPAVSSTPSVTPTPTASTAPTATTTPTASTAPTATPTPAVSTAPTATPTPAASIAPTATAVPNPTINTAPTVTATLTPTVSDAPTATVTPTDTLTPTVSITPTVSPVPTTTPAATSNIFSVAEQLNGFYSKSNTLIHFPDHDDYALVRYQIVKSGEAPTENWKKLKSDELELTKQGKQYLIIQGINYVDGIATVQTETISSTFVVDTKKPSIKKIKSKKGIITLKVSDSVSGISSVKANGKTVQKNCKTYTFKVKKGSKLVVTDKAGNKVNYIAR